MADVFDIANAVSLEVRAVHTDAAWWFLPWHNDGAVAYHSAGARNTAVEWCGDGNNLYWDRDDLGCWCADEDLCSSNHGTLFQGHGIVECAMRMKNVDDYDQEMSYIEWMGQQARSGSDKPAPG